MNVKNKLFFSILALSCGLASRAQEKTAPVARKPAPSRTAHPARKPAPKVTLKTTQDSLCYSIGLSVASFFKQQNITDINTAMVARAIDDVTKKDSLLMNEQQANAWMLGYMQRLKSEKASGNKKAGEEFLAANKTKPGVITTASGLQYLVLKEGTGPKPSLTDKVKCHYHGTLIDGRVFDSSVDRGQPIELSVNGVIPGWTEALQLMPVGSKWKLFIPSNLAYGDQQAGALIAPGSTLVFDIELLDIIKP
ncbi:MAG: FKBP-type peptidyl-prolyl cis-trans isomerase [Bacteroidota bacterium]|nr:FKBP-type peptidyl-prolyl cis-trans isomerase [Bacteroidota bacterium]